MKQHLSKQAATILSILIFTIAIMLSSNVFARKPDMATQAELDAVISTEDTALRALISIQQTALNKAVTDILALQAAVAKLTAPKIGDHFGGGIVFYVDGTGQHGLIAALADQSAGIQWYNGADKVTGATGDGVGAGATNTAIIVAAQSNDTIGGNFAAKVANDYSVRDDGSTACDGSAGEICHGDWYLPSKYELNLLYQKKDVVGGFADDYYWSSTEDDNLGGAWDQGFLNGAQYDSVKSVALRVRAVRAF